MANIEFDFTIPRELSVTRLGEYLRQGTPMIHLARGVTRGEYSTVRVYVTADYAPEIFFHLGYLTKKFIDNYKK